MGGMGICMVGVTGVEGAVGEAPCTSLSRELTALEASAKVRLSTE